MGPASAEQITTRTPLRSQQVGGMVVRSQRMAEAVPGQPRAGATVSAAARTLGRFRFYLTRRATIVAISVCCISIMLISGLPPVGYWHLKPPQSGLEPFTSSTTTPTQTDYPYVIDPWWYPPPSNLTGQHAFEFPRLTALGSGFALLNLSYASSKTTLWFTTGSYSPTIATAIYSKQACLSGSVANGTCVATPTVPIQWSHPAAIATVSSAVSADALASLGSEVVVAVTEGTAATWLYFSSNSGSTWSSGTELKGTGGFPSLVLDPQYLFAADFSSVTIWGSTYALGSNVAVANYTVSAPNAIQNLSVALLPASVGFTTTIVVSTTSADQILYSQLGQGGSSFSSWRTVASYSVPASSYVFNSVGGTVLTSAGGLAGQLASVDAGSALFVLYTTSIGGRIAVETTVSTDGGINWTGPYLSTPPAGSVQDPTLTEGADQLTYAAWRVYNGTWGIDQAVYLPDGATASLPAELPGSGVGPNAATGAPSIALDQFQRPLFVWPAAVGATSFQLDYGGAYPNASVAVNLLDDSLYDPVTFYDVGGGGGSSGGSGSGSTGSTIKTVAELDANVTTAVTDVTQNATGKNATVDRCSAVNLTVDKLYILVTHLVLGSTGGSTCKTASAASNSPLTNDTGSFVPNIYLANYADVALEAEGFTVATAPLTQLIPTAQSGSGLTPPQTSKGNATQGAKTWTWINVTSIPWSPTSIQLSASQFSSFSSVTSSENIECCNPAPPPICAHPPDEYVTDSDTPAKISAKVTILSGNDPTATYSSTTSTPTVFLANLSAYSTVQWKATYTANYTATQSVRGATGDCSGTTTTSVSPASVGMPSQLNANLSGNGTTQLGIVPGSRFVYAPFTSTSQAHAALSVNWNNSMEASVNGTLYYTSNFTTAATLSNSSYEIAESYSLGTQKVNSNFTLSLSAQSRTGGWTTAQEPSVSNGESLQYPAQVAQGGCSFELTPPWFNIGFGSVSGITSGSAVVQWRSNVSGEGELRYFAYFTGVNETIQGVPAVYNSSLSGQDKYVYTVQLHDLLPWAQYNVSYGLYADRGCLAESLMVSQNGSFATPPVLGLTENDLPYDSISGEGGGAQFGWTVPSYFLGLHPTLVSGALAYTYSGGAVFVPLNTSEIYNPGGMSREDQAINLTLPAMNTSYTATLWLNYTYVNPGNGTKVAVQAESPTISFVYELDSSGDGLTNLEKVNGWIVPVPSSQTFEGIGLSGTTSLVTAYPWAWATNGLVNDYVEKEYDLNPRTIDTAESHMLDTWNLTFNLGSSDSCPAEFSCYTDTAINPFNETQYPGDNHTGKPASVNTTAPHYPLDDSVPYDATVLWEGTTLAYLQGLIQDETFSQNLRGFIGKYDGSYTLTVWGKLSWGADPLVASSIHDGLADGSRINPASAVDLEIGGLDATCSGLSGDGWAVELTLRNGTATSGAAELSNYSAPAVGCGSSSSEKITNYIVALPISQTNGNQTLQLKVVAKEGSTLTPLPFNGVANEANITFNLFGSATKDPSSGTWTGTGTDHATLNLTLRSVAVGGKAPTFLWLPDDNSTVNGLPMGLERYTGEQSFDLVVVNASTSISSGSIPLPWGGTYSITLQAGLNNLLVPREEFLNTSFGRGVLENATEPYTNTTANPPLIVSGGDENLISNFGASTLLGELSCYWQDRAVSSGTGTNTGCKESGTASKTEGAITVVAVDSSAPPANNTGGVPGNPALENGTEAGAAVQAVVTLNVTTANEVELLLAGLLDNVTGGVNGTFQSITSEVPFMGFYAPVLGALANATVVTGGLYGAPSTTTPSQTPSGSAVWGWLWNAPAEVVTTIAHGVVSLVDIVYTVTVAATTYLNHLAREALALAGTLLARTAMALEAAGQVLRTGLSELATFVVSALKSILAAVINPVLKVASAFDSGVAAGMNASGSDVGAGHQVTVGHAQQLVSALGGSVTMLALALGIAIAIGITIATPLDFGPSLIVSVILSLIILGLTAAFSKTLGATLLTDSAIWAVDSGANLTFSGNTAPAVQIDWKALAESFGVASALPAILLAVYVGMKMPANQLTLPLAALVLAMVSVAIELVVWATQLPQLIVVALTFAMIGVIISFLGVRAIPQTLPNVRFFGYVALGFAGASLTAAAYDASTIV
jgi:hypothetical protein